MRLERGIGAPRSPRWTVVRPVRREVMLPRPIKEIRTGQSEGDDLRSPCAPVQDQKIAIGRYGVLWENVSLLAT